MAVTLTPEAAAVHARITAQTGEYGQLDMQVQMMLANMLDAATELVEGYAESAPVAIQDESAARIVSFLWDSSPVNRNPVDAFAFSGARALLSSWHIPVTGGTAR